MNRSNINFRPALTYRFIIQAFLCFQQVPQAIVKGRNQKGVCHKPRKRRSEAYDNVAEDGNQCKSNQSPGDHLADTGENGKKTVAHSLNGKTPYIDDGKRNIKQRIKG